MPLCCRPFWLRSVDKKQYKILVEKSKRFRKIWWFEPSTVLLRWATSLSFVFYIPELSCLTLPGASVNETKLWNVVKIAIIRTQRKRDEHIEQSLVALFSCSTWVKSEDIEEQPYLEVCRGPPGQGRPVKLAAASILALRGRWPPSTCSVGGAHRGVKVRARIISQ